MITSAGSISFFILQKDEGIAMVDVYLFRAKDDRKPVNAILARVGSINSKTVITLAQIYTVLQVFVFAPDMDIGREPPQVIGPQNKLPAAYTGYL